MFKTYLTISGLLLCGACSGTYKVPSRINTKLLRAAPADQIQLVEKAAQQGSAARTAYRAAREETQFLGRAVLRARQELEVVVSAVDDAGVALTAARKIGNTTGLSRAQTEYDDLLTMGRIARLGLSLARREHELAALAERLALEESRLCDAEVEVARAAAVTGLDLPAGEGVPLADLQEQSIFHHREVEVVRQRLSHASVRLTAARADYEGALLANKRDTGTRPSE